MNTFDDIARLLADTPNPTPAQRSRSIWSAASYMLTLCPGGSFEWKLWKIVTVVAHYGAHLEERPGIYSESCIAHKIVSIWSRRI